MGYIIDDAKIRLLAESIMCDIRKYREIEADSDDDPKSVTWDELAAQYEAGPEYNAVTCWAMSIRSKLELVNIIGGFDLASCIMDYLEAADDRIIEQNDNGEDLTVYDFVSAFDVMADGVIDGWIN